MIEAPNEGFEIPSFAQVRLKSSEETKPCICVELQLSNGEEEI